MLRKVQFLEPVTFWRHNMPQYYKLLGCTELVLVQRCRNIVTALARCSPLLNVAHAWVAIFSAIVPLIRELHGGVCDSSHVLPVSVPSTKMYTLSTVLWGRGVLAGKLRRGPR
ncbi:hypothetical protein GDO78_015464 [Eleutherodactylus coqui]|uniref:Uncharacterized protein n=1 Tax=Eleutherodactylus coqui TaxID=57060 RepID=A0A8J6B2B5_ELECQ|nr:hypothetical protein GDO78_015464 [Eleutherodactylus coqui]